MKLLGFSFDPRPDGLLKCAYYSKHAYWNACSEPDVCHSPYWVLDYSINGGLLNCSTPFVDPGIRGAHTAHLYPPGQTYYQRHLHSGHESSAWIIFSGEFSFLHQLSDNPGHFLRILDPEHILCRLLIEIAENAVHGNSHYWKCHAKFYEVIHCLSKLTPLDDKYSFTLSESNAATLAERVVHYLETHYQEKVSMQRIASVLGVSVSSLAHRYQAEKSETVMDTLLRIRIQQSLPLLTAGFPLKVIAEKVGFCNEFYFSRQFKKIQKISPGSWRDRFF